VEINQAVDEYSELIAYSQYTMQLKPYFEIFGQERVLPVFFERMIKYPQEELERVCRFIGYKGKPLWDDGLNAQNVSTERMRKSGWRDFLVEAPGLKQLRRWLIPKSFRTWVRSLWTMKKKPELEAQQVENLRAIFDEDLAVLGSWLGIELSCENFKSSVKTEPRDWVPGSKQEAQLTIKQRVWNQKQGHKFPLRNPTGSGKNLPVGGIQAGSC
jgi:hypothetical protein